MSKPPSNYRAIPDFYDAEYAGVEALRHDTGFLLSYLETLDAPLDLVEIGCGTGRAAIPVAREGHRVLGIDVDPQMLARRETARKKAGLDDRYLHFLAADASDPDWPTQLGPDRRFDGAFCVFNTFLAMARPEQQENCLAAVHRVLRPDGWLWLDLFNPSLELIVGSIGGARDLEPTLFHTADGRSVMRLTSLKANVVRQVQRVTFNYRWYESGRLKKARRQFEMAWIMPRELDRLLRLSGFTVEQTWGDYTGAPLVDGSPRQIVLARRS